MNTIVAKISLRGDTAANWTSGNPVLELNEWGIENDTVVTSSGIEFFKVKRGDGATEWNSLPYSNFGQFDIETRRQAFYYNVDSTTTGSTSETVVANIAISANPMGANGWMDIDMFQYKPINAISTCTWKVYWCTVGTNTIGTTGVPSGGILIGTNALSANIKSQRWIRRLVNQNSASANFAYNVSTTTSTETTANTSDYTTLSINTANAGWIVVTVTASNNADILGTKAVNVQTINNP